MMIGNFSVVFNLASLSPMQLQFQQDLSISEIGYSRLHQVQAIPGVIFPILAGVLADYYGASMGVGVGLGTGLLGQLLITFGVFIERYWWILGGFFVQSTGICIPALSKNKFIYYYAFETQL